MLVSLRPLLCTKLSVYNSFIQGKVIMLPPVFSQSTVRNVSTEKATTVATEISALLTQASQMKPSTIALGALNPDIKLSSQLGEENQDPTVAVVGRVKQLVPRESSPTLSGLPLIRSGPYDTDTVIGRAEGPVNMMKKLKYFQYYPSRIQKWVSFARMPKGHYNELGYWRNDPYLMEAELPKRKELLELGRKRQRSRHAVEEREQMIKDNPLPEDLVGKYRFGVKPEETVNLSPKFKEWLTFRHANNYEINGFRIEQAVKKWQSKPYDTGSTGVQIAVLTERINYLTKHIMKNKKDISTKLGLRDLISKRFRLMKYCKRKNVPLYYALLKDLNLKDMVP